VLCPHLDDLHRKDQLGILEGLYRCCVLTHDQFWISAELIAELGESTAASVVIASSIRDC
jgi:hypothetical protein